jgi:hypothetical protein
VRVALRLVPLSLADANRYVTALHRHNGPLPSAKFCCGVVDTESFLLVGVAIAGLPKARMLTDGGTLEVNRVCTDGSRNACSKLYGACVRAAKALGYWRMVTYTLESEAGSSLRASGWTLSAEGLDSGSWLGSRGTGTNLHTGPKSRWQIVLADRPPAFIYPELVQPEHATLSLFDLEDDRRI